jgi:ATP-binding cassette, subfamily F, member 3
VAQIQANNVSVAYGDRDLLDAVTMTISSTDRCALSGANGSGKSTLMRILASLSTPDSGAVVLSRGTTVTYLPQSGITHRGRTLIQEVELAYESIHAMIRKKHTVEESLAQPELSEREAEVLIHEQHDLEEHILASGYYDREAIMDQVLTGLGFTRDDLDRPTAEFSGGWQMRIALAKILLNHADFLLLDEPTNYLDLEARVWLSSFLRDYEGGVLLVSHDRTFLDETINVVYELFLGTLQRYPGNYSSYERRRTQELEQTIRAYELQQQEIARIEDFIRRFRYKATKAKQVQSRIKQLEKMERIEIPETMKHVAFRFPGAPHSGKEMVRIHGLSKSYGRRRVLKDVETLVSRGDRIALVGPNGAGKSTLMRIIAGTDVDYEGAVSLGTGVVIAFYAQDSAEQMLSFSSTVLEAVLEHAHGRTEQQIRNLLGAFLFRGDDIHKAVSVLSGGERSRLSLLMVLLSPANLLILDEPTNHLDMSSKRVLLDALTHWDGTAVFVSHDRDFIEETASRVMELQPRSDDPAVPSRFSDIPGDYGYYRHWSARVTDAPEGTGAPPKVADGQPRAADGQFRSHTEQKALRNQRALLERKSNRLLDQIDGLETRKRDLELQMASEEVYTDPESIRDVTSRLKQTEAQLEQLSHEWDQVSDELVALESSTA